MSTTSTSLSTVIPVISPVADNRASIVAKANKEIIAYSTYVYWSNYSKFPSTSHGNNQPYSNKVYANSNMYAFYQQASDIRKKKTAISEGIKEFNILFEQPLKFSVLSPSANTSVGEFSQSEKF